LEGHWQGLITWCPGGATTGIDALGVPSRRRVASPMMPTARPDGSGISVPGAHGRSDRVGGGRTTQPGYVNRNGQQVVRPTGNPGTDHGQYVYVLRCRTCSHEYGANGSDIFQRRCPAHDGGAPGLAI
jgi:hypothetical protein